MRQLTLMAIEAMSLRLALRYREATRGCESRPGLSTQDVDVQAFPSSLSPVHVPEKEGIAEEKRTESSKPPVPPPQEEGKWKKVQKWRKRRYLAGEMLLLLLYYPLDLLLKEKRGG